MPRYWIGRHAALVTLVAAAVESRIGIEDFPVKSTSRNPDSVTAAHYRRKVTQAHYPASGARRGAKKRDYVIV